jgi:peptide/nickel transport system substrate-binding protein
MKTMKRLLPLLLALVMLLSLCACGNTTPTPAQEAPAAPAAEEPSNPAAEEPTAVEEPEPEPEPITLTIAITKDENSLAPFTYVSATGLTVNRLVYDTLFTPDMENNVVPWMVEDDYTVENNQVYTMKLLPGQFFHNGNPVNADAVKFSFEYPADKNVSGQRKVCNKIESIEVLGELELRFTLKAPDVNFLRDGFCLIRIIDPAVYEGVEDPTTVEKSIGSGMYRLAEYKTGEYYVLEAVEGYFRGTPTVQTINMPIMGDSTAIQQGILSGELAASTGNIGMEMVETFAANPDLAVVANADYGPTIININNERAPFDQVDFRRALTYAIDVNDICHMIYGDYALPGAPGCLRTDLPYANQTPYTYDPARAIELLEGLGYTELNADGIRLDKDGNPLHIQILSYAESAQRTRICELMAEDLAEVGIELELVTMDMDTADTYIWPDFDVANGRDYDLSTWGWGTAAGNSYTYLISLCHSDPEVGTYNVCGFKSERFDALVDDTTITSIADMEELLRQLQEIVIDEVPLITIGCPDKLQVVNTALYDGWQAGKGANVVNVFSFLP